MATPRKVTLTITKNKPAAVFATSSVTGGTVEVHFDSEDTQLDVINSLEKCIELIREQEF